jgi:hypothetical protein
MSKTGERVSASPAPGPKSATRFGPTAIIREGPPSQDTHLLPLFAFAVDGTPAPVERRESPRLPAVERRAWLGWWATPDQFQTFAARLDDISQGGAKLVTSDPPPTQQVVWLCLGMPEPTECVQAKVLQVIPTADGVAIVRIAFGMPCPHNLYQVAIHGLAQAKGR